MNIITSYIIGNWIYRLADNGLANLLGLETLRHGTNLINFFGIRFFGGDPSHGGKITGSTEGHNDDKDVKNYFFMFKDSERKSDTDIDKRCSFYEKAIITFIGQPEILVRWHTFLSGYNFSYCVFKGKAQSKAENIGRIIFSGLGGLTTLIFTPILHFRFSKIDPNRLQDDPHYHGAAYETSQKVEAWRIGIIGTLISGVNKEWFSRVKNNPTKVLTGVAQLTVAAIITILALNIIIAQPYLLVPAGIGMILA